MRLSLFSVEYTLFTSWWTTLMAGILEFVTIVIVGFTQHAEKRKDGTEKENSPKNAGAYHLF